MTFAYPNSWTIEGEEISNGEFMGVRTLTLSSFGQPKRQGGVRKAGRKHYVPFFSFSPPLFLMYSITRSKSDMNLLFAVRYDFGYIA